jgi:RecA-family ATPase
LVEQEAKRVFLVQELIPNPSLILLVGDSGLGKSALQYQLAICVAAGIPFLGLPVQRGRVLYLDYENGRDQANTIVQQISTFLGLESGPENLLMWNYNDCSSPSGSFNYGELIKDVRPSLVVVDSITAMHPAIEEKTQMLRQSFKITDVG